LFILTGKKRNGGCPICPHPTGGTPATRGGAKAKKREVGKTKDHVGADSNSEKGNKPGKTGRHRSKSKEPSIRGKGKEASLLLPSSELLPTCKNF